MSKQRYALKYVGDHPERKRRKAQKDLFSFSLAKLGGKRKRRELIAQKIRNLMKNEGGHNHGR